LSGARVLAGPMQGDKRGRGVPEQAQEPVVDASKEVGHVVWRLGDWLGGEEEVSARGPAVDGRGGAVWGA